MILKVELRWIKVEIYKFCYFQFIYFIILYVLGIQKFKYIYT